MKVEYTEKVKAKAFVSYHKDFDHENYSWKESYFKLLSWKNTFSIPYKMDINDNRKNGVFVYILIPVNNPDTPVMLKEMMEDWGYGDIKITDYTVEVVCPDFEEGVDEYVLEY